MKLFRFLSSIQLATMVLVGLAAALTTATVIESLTDTPTAQYWVYKSWYFKGLLSFLGLNMFCVMVSRWPWKKRHIAFLMAHIGTLVILAGSWVTYRIGIDGNLRVSEGESANQVELDTAQLVATTGEETRFHPIPWHPPELGPGGVDLEPRANRVDLKSEENWPWDLRIEKYLTHAEGSVHYEPKSTPVPTPDRREPAVQIRISGGPMRITQDFWLWAGDPSYGQVEAGPAVLSLGFKPMIPLEDRRVWLALLPEPDGSVKFVSRNREGQEKSGKLAAGKIQGSTLDPGWKMVSVKVMQWVPDARVVSEYRPSRIQYGQQAPPSAILVSAGDGKGGERASIWLGQGDRAKIHAQGQDINLSYGMRRLVLPFSVTLKRFHVDRYAGSMDPSSYRSDVVITSKSGVVEKTISMNEPATEAGITLYQASYEDAMPRPVTSILSVNHDPGRGLKYLGSLIFVLGTILYFVEKLKVARQKAARVLSED